MIPCRHAYQLRMQSAMKGSSRNLLIWSTLSSPDRSAHRLDICSMRSIPTSQLPSMARVHKPLLMRSPTPGNNCWLAHRGVVPGVQVLIATNVPNSDIETASCSGSSGFNAPPALAGPPVAGRQRPQPILPASVLRPLRSRAVRGVWQGADGGGGASASGPGYRWEVSSVTMSAADCGCLARATLCPAPSRALRCHRWSRPSAGLARNERLLRRRRSARSHRLLLAAAPPRGGQHKAAGSTKERRRGLFGPRPDESSGPRRAATTVAVSLIR